MKNKVFGVILAVLTYFAVFVCNSKFADGLCRKFTVNSILWLCAVIAVFIYYSDRRKSFNKRGRTTALITGCFMSVTFVLGESFSNFDNMSMFFDNGAQFIYTFIRLLAEWIIIYVFITAGFSMTDAFIGNYSHDLKLASVFTGRRYSVFLIAGLFLLIWLPFIIAFFPGNIPWDGFAQINACFGVSKWTNHHPPFSSLLMGICIKIGRTIYSDNLGMAIYTISQTVLGSLIFSYQIIVMKRKLNVKNWGIYLVFIFYGFFPIWIDYLMLMMKDTSYVLFFLLFITMNVEMMKDKSLFLRNKLKMVLFVANISLLCLTRNNGLYIMILSLLVDVVILIRYNKRPEKGHLFEKQDLKRLIYAIIIGVLLFKAADITIKYTFGITRSNSAEALSIPLQQTARYVRDHGDEVTDEERDAIDAVLDYDSLASKYRPEISDNVKVTFKHGTTTDEKLDYVKVYLEQFMKHPSTYFEATYNNIYSYFYISLPKAQNNLGHYVIQRNPDINKGYFDFHYTFSNLAELRNFFRDLPENVRTFPVIGWLYSAAFYTNAYIIAFAYLIYRKSYKALYVFIPVISTLLINLASPVNGFIRYTTPVMVSLPILIGFCIDIIRKGDTEYGQNSSIDSVL